MCCEPGQGARTTLHAVVRFQCAAGMKLEGEADRATCTAAGRWSHPVPRCLAPCILPDIQHGNIRDSTGILMSRPQQIYFCLLMIKSSLLNNGRRFLVAQQLNMSSCMFFFFCLSHPPWVLGQTN